MVWITDGSHLVVLFDVKLHRFDSNKRLPFLVLLLLNSGVVAIVTYMSRIVSADGMALSFIKVVAGIILISHHRKGQFILLLKEIA